MFQLDTVKIKEDNPRKINPDRLEQLKNSIKDFPDMLALRPIVYDPANMQILAGNQRYTGLLELGYTEVPDEWVQSIGDLPEELKPKGVAVTLSAQHLCMCMRGVKKQGAMTVTSKMLGVFKDDLNCRNEFLTLIK